MYYKKNFQKYLQIYANCCSIQFLKEFNKNLLKNCWDFKKVQVILQ